MKDYHINTNIVSDIEIFEEDAKRLTRIVNLAATKELEKIKRERNMVKDIKAGEIYSDHLLVIRINKKYSVIHSKTFDCYNDTILNKTKEEIINWLNEREYKKTSYIGN